MFALRLQFGVAKNVSVNGRWYSVAARVEVSLTTRSRPLTTGNVVQQQGGGVPIAAVFLIHVHESGRRVSVLRGRNGSVVFLRSATSHRRAVAIRKVCTPCKIATR